MPGYNIEVKQLSFFDTSNASEMHKIYDISIQENFLIKNQSQSKSLETS